jgi:hypothetical protein
MKSLAVAILLMALIAASVSCKKEVIGNGPVTTQTRTVSNFTGIDLRMNGMVYYTNATEQKLEIVAKESIHSILETKVVDNRLVIRYTNGKTYDEDESIRINISGPGVNSLETNSSGSIYCMNAIQPTNLFVRTSGSGNVSLQNVVTGNLEAESTQSGRVFATGGSANSEKIKTDGSGKVDLSAVTAKSVTGRIIGSGDIKVKATDYLDATIDGSGDIYFSGSPLITTHINGSGRLIRF